MEEYVIQGDFIELHDLLKVVGICSTGGMAKTAIAGGLVKVDGQVETRKRCKITSGQLVEYDKRAVRVRTKDDTSA